jgi:hypothetical protein
LRTLPGDRFISNNCIADNFIVKDLSEFFFVRAHRIKDKWFCSLNYYSIPKNEVYRFEKAFPRALHIKQFVSGTNLEIYHAFHDKLPEYKDFFDIEKEPFQLV